LLVSAVICVYRVFRMRRVWRWRLINVGRMSDLSGVIAVRFSIGTRGMMGVLIIVHG
jgi:hypothetical protein